MLHALKKHLQGNNKFTFTSKPLKTRKKRRLGTQITQQNKNRETQPKN
jgi:hypothetical protein